MRPKKKSATTLERDVGTWNAEVPVGAPVNYRNDRGKIIETHTKSPASVLGDHTAVVWLEGVRGCIALRHVTPREER
jgi:hypothetical protein